MAFHSTRVMMLRVISLFMVSAFTVTTLIGDPSQALAAAEIFNPSNGMQSENGILQDLHSMPAEFGSLVSYFSGTRQTSNQNESRVPSPESRFVVMLQDAHANPEGQQNIAAMLQYLEDKAPSLMIGLEGASGALHPEYLEFFKEYPEANQAVIEDLKQKGELNGVERYLLEKTGATRNAQQAKNEPNSLSVERRTLRVPVVRGIENAELYRDNLNTYRDLLGVSGKIEKALMPLRTELEKESSEKLSGELRDFLKERSRRKDGRFNVTGSAGDPDLQAYVRYLRGQSLKFLEIDLKDPIEQLRFPNLLRVVMLEETRKGYDAGKVQSQWEEAIRTLRAAAKTAEEKDFLGELVAFAGKKKFIQGPAVPSAHLAVDRAFYPRALVEGLFRFSQKQQLSFAGREAFWQSWKLAVFQAEIDVSGLLEEMNRLEDGLLEKLAHSEAEKALVQKLGNLDLLEKMLRLELSRKEYDKILAGRGAIRSLVTDSKPLSAALEKAHHFYEVSRERDQVLIENALAFSAGTRQTRNPNESQAPSPKSRITVIYSGGFHTPGIEEILRERGIGYAVLSPRITKTDHGEMYQKVMTDDNADLSGYFKVKNPFFTKQEALFFKQLIETAAPALSKTYKLSPGQVARKVSQAVKGHPVLAEVVMADQGSDVNAASVSFQPKPNLQVLVPT